MTEYFKDWFYLSTKSQLKVKAKQNFRDFTDKFVEYRQNYRNEI